MFILKWLVPKKNGKLESVFVLQLDELIHVKLKNVHIQIYVHFTWTGFDHKQNGTSVFLNFLK
jgi:ABC-type uncharacterized transport system substrate-binding protein